MIKLAKRDSIKFNITVNMIHILKKIILKYLKPSIIEQTNICEQKIFGSYS